MINVMACPYPDLEPIFSLVKYVISIVSVIIPIILIVMGIIDLSKAVMGKDEGEIKKNQSIFVKRIIYAVAIFFVYTIVVLVMNLVDKYIGEDANSWVDCFGGKYKTPSETSQEKAERYCKDVIATQKDECVSCYIVNNFNAVYREGVHIGKCDTTIAIQ